MAVNPLHSERKIIPTLVKDSSLVEERRAKIVDAAVGLFISKGYHQSTTREIARAAGFSIGTLYEYIESKEDVLYLVCESIHTEMEAQLREALGEQDSTIDRLEGAIEKYIRVCDRMQDSILLIYRDTASLSKESQRYVLQNEQRIADIFAEILEAGVADETFKLDNDGAFRLMAHNIVVLGHMWAFRRWFLRGKFTLDEFIDQQTSLIMGELIQRRNERFGRKGKS